MMQENFGACTVTTLKGVFLKSVFMHQTSDSYSSINFISTEVPEDSFKRLRYLVLICIRS